MGGPFGSNLTTGDFVDQGVPVIQGRNMVGRRVSGDFVFVTPEKARALSGNLARPGDLIFTQRGTLGQVALVPSGRYEEYLVSQSQMKLTVDSAKADPLFLYYLFLSPGQQEYIQRNAIRTGVPHTNLGILRRTPISLPPLAEQHAIAGTLGALDDKIELNRRMNETLEVTARAIFKSWFVDFDPVRARMSGRQPVGMDAETAALFPDSFDTMATGPIPRGWRFAGINEIASLNAWSLRDEDELNPILYVEISSVNRGDVLDATTYHRGEEPSRARRRVQHGDTVLSTVRPERRAFFLCLDPPDNLVVSTGFVTVTPVAVPWSFLHSALTQPDVFDELGNLATGGAYPAVRPEVVGGLNIPAPQEPAVLNAFHQVAAPLLERAHLNRRESQALAEIRDALLPRLIAGQVDRHYSGVGSGGSA